MNEDHPYLDTSAVAKLLIRREPGADLAVELVARSAEIHTSLLTFPETMSALTRAHRDRCLTDEELQDAVTRFAAIWPRFRVVQLSVPIADDAAAFILRFPLSGADAVQVASALSIRQKPVQTFVTWDRRQAEAARALGFTVQPPID